MAALYTVAGRQYVNSTVVSCAQNCCCLLLLDVFLTPPHLKRLDFAGGATAFAAAVTIIIHRSSCKHALQGMRIP
jgi:hypothetical protein